MYPKTLSLLLLISISFGTMAQQAAIKSEKKIGWHLLNKAVDGYYGTGVKEAYELLANRKPTTVTIAVIDSGIDTLHEDLKEHLWTNPKEIPGNGKDDDGNGYVDDVHGWNFCGSKEGENLSHNTHEIARVFHQWKAEFQGKLAKDIPADRLFAFHQWQRADSLLQKQYDEYLKSFDNVRNYATALHTTSRLILAETQTSEFNFETIEKMKGKDSLAWALRVWKSVFKDMTSKTVSNVAVLKDIDGYQNTLQGYKDRHDDAPTDFRGQLTKDKVDDVTDRIYGNNNLYASAGNHGTHVSGIIGAIRNNGKGVDGIVDQVRIMFIRAVPGGDEHDKDVALAIRFAVDNGASIINMSFGKPVSPYKKMVDDAVQYAAAKNVLLVHGAGNDGEDLDKSPFYPNPYLIDGTKATNYLTVGASGDYSTGGLVADFSNYGQGVDLFAPGVYIQSTTFSNGYEAFDGTSMASPVAAGVAGLIKSYFPQITPPQMIDLLVSTGTPITEKVTIPGGEEKVPMTRLCSSGKIINAYEAAKKALALYGEKGK